MTQPVVDRTSEDKIDDLQCALADMLDTSADLLAALRPTQTVSERGGTTYRCQMCGAWATLTDGGADVIEHTYRCDWFRLSEARRSAEQAIRDL